MEYEYKFDHEVSRAMRLRVEEGCGRGAVTPVGNLLIVDCSEHGFIGLVIAGDDELQHINDLTEIHIQQCKTQ